MAPEYFGLSRSQNVILAIAFQTNLLDSSFSTFSPQKTQLKQFSTGTKSMDHHDSNPGSIIFCFCCVTLGILHRKLLCTSAASSVKWEQ